MIMRITVLILALATAQGCGGDATGPIGGGDNGGVGNHGGGVPAALVGSWRLSAATGSQVCDDLGHCGPAYGGSESYQFTADGRFVYSELLEANLGGCSQTAFLYATGQVVATGSAVTLEPASLRNRRTNTCGANSDDTFADVDPSHYTWRVTADGLYLTGADAVEHGPYEKS